MYLDTHQDNLWEKKDLGKEQWLQAPQSRNTGNI